MKEKDLIVGQAVDTMVLAEQKEKDRQFIEKDPAAAKWYELANITLFQLF